MTMQTSFQGQAGGLPNSFTADPMLAHYRAWISARQGWHAVADLPGNGNWNSPESQAFAVAEEAARDAMLSTQPQTFAGIAALVHLAWDELGPSVVPDSPEYEEQAAAIELQPLVHLWKALTGEAQPPQRKGVDMPFDRECDLKQEA